MKIEVNGKEDSKGFDVQMSMTGKLNLIYVPQLVTLLLDGIASHGKDVEVAVYMGIHDFMEKREKHE